MIKAVAVAVLLLAAPPVLPQSVNTTTPTPCTTCRHHTKWWVSVIVTLAATSLYAVSSRTIEEAADTPPDQRGPAGAVVARQLGVKYGISGVVITGEWFLLKYQGGAKHPRLEKSLTIINYLGAASLSGLAASTLRDRRDDAQPVTLH